MHRAIATLAPLALVCLGGTAAQAFDVTSTETFDSGNEGNWSWGANDMIFMDGGNPGAHLVTEGLDTFAAMPDTTGPSVFTGDYRKRGVRSFGIDLITYRTDFGIQGKSAYLMLIHDNGTPGDQLDDTAAYVKGDLLPPDGAGWKSFDWEIPSESTSIPEGWVFLNLGDLSAPPAHSWNQIIQNVGRVRIHYGNPRLISIFQTWDLGLDNPRITALGDADLVTICHYNPANPAEGNTIELPEDVARAHVAHGDDLGPCAGN